MDRISKKVFGTMLVVAGLMFGAASANAACGLLPGTGSQSPIKLPMLAQAENNTFGASSQSIVGLWHVIYTIGSSKFNETFDTWHSDGTEFETAYLPVEMGNVCAGVWKTVGFRTIRLHHVGWLFTPGVVSTATGSFTLDETVEVAADGKTYSGSFTFTQYDTNGVVQKPTPLTGTMAATRITVE
jgi:hypothetical protein